MSTLAALLDHSSLLLHSFDWLGVTGSLEAVVDRPGVDSDMLAFLAVCGTATAAVCPPSGWEQNDFSSRTVSCSSCTVFGSTARTCLSVSRRIKKTANYQFDSRLFAHKTERERETDRQTDRAGEKVRGKREMVCMHVIVVSYHDKTCIASNVIDWHIFFS